MQILRFFWVRACLCFAGISLVCGALVFMMPRLADLLERVWIEHSLEKRFGDQLHYKAVSKAENGWKLTQVQITTPIAYISCPECLLQTRYFSASLEDMTTEGLISWIDPSIPPCILQIQQGDVRLIEKGSGKMILRWDGSAYHLKDLPCKLAFLFASVAAPHPLADLWVADSGVMSGSLKKIQKTVSPKRRDVPFEEIDLTFCNLQLHLAKTPLHFFLKEGTWKTGHEGLCSGSGALECQLAGTSFPVLEIPASDWNLSFLDQTLLLDFRGRMQQLAAFLGFKKEIPGPFALKAKLPLSQMYCTGSFYLGSSSLPLPFFVEFGLKTGWKASLEGELVPLDPLFSSLFLLSAEHKLHGRMNLKGSLSYPDWQIQAEPVDAILETPDFFLQVDAWESPLFLKGDLHTGLYELNAEVSKAHAEHSSGLVCEALSCLLQADQGSISLREIDGYINNIWFTGSSLYSPYETDSLLTLHLDSASGKISSLQSLMRSSNLSFLANFPCEGSVVLSKEGANLVWNAEGVLDRCQINGSLLDLKLVNVPTCLKAHDLSCRWRYDLVDHAFVLYDLHGSLDVIEEEHDSARAAENAVQNVCLSKQAALEQVRQTFLLQSDQLCSFKGGESSMDLDLSIWKVEKKLLSLAGRLDWSQKGQIVLDCCKERCCFGSSRPEKLIFLLEEDARLRSIDLVITCQLEDSLDVLKSISRIPYIAMEPFFIDWLSRLQHVQGRSYFVCHYDKPASTMQYRLEADRLEIEQTRLDNCLFEGSITPKEWRFDQVRWNGWQASTSLEKTPQAWNIPFLALQYKNLLLAGFKGRFNKQTQSLEGELPLLTLFWSKKQKITLPPLWIEANFLSPLAFPSSFRLYDTPKGSSLEVQLDPLSLQGDLWGCQWNFVEGLKKGCLEGTLGWNSSNQENRGAAAWQTLLDRLQVKASCQLDGTLYAPFTVEGLSFQGKVSAPRGRILGGQFPAWHANLSWSPEAYVLSSLSVEDPYLLCSLEFLKIEGGLNGVFQLKNFQASEKPLSLLTSSSLPKIGFPWHPHLLFSSVQISSLQGNLAAPYAFTGKVNLQFHRPGLQRRFVKEDPLLELFSLPDLLTPIQGTISAVAHQGKWRLTEESHAYSEGKLVEFLLVPERSASISETGQLDITLQARPARRKFNSTKKQVFSIRGPIWQPTCSLESM